MGVRVIAHKHRQFDVVGVYRPGRSLSDFTFVDKIVGYVGNDSERTVVLGGDLNLPGVDWEGNADSRNHEQIMVNRMIWESGMIQVVSEPTRGENTLDVVLVKPEDFWKQTKVIDGISDHKVVMVDLNVVIGKAVNRRVKVHKLYHKVDQAGLNDFLSNKYHQWVAGNRDADAL